jgi:hypothetical protein
MQPLFFQPSEGLSLIWPSFQSMRKFLLTESRNGIGWSANQMTKPKPDVIDYRDYLSIIGRRGGQKGGKSKSKAKTEAARKNGRLGGRKKKQFRGAK